LYFGFSIGFSCQADNYKIPAQQQAVNVVGNAFWEGCGWWWVRMIITYSLILTSDKNFYYGNIF
jgi:hypothetical protein